MSDASDDKETDMRDGNKSAVDSPLTTSDWSEWLSGRLDSCLSVEVLGRLTSMTDDATWNAGVARARRERAAGYGEDSLERARRRAPMVSSFEPACEQDVQLLALSPLMVEASYGDISTDRELETLVLPTEIVEVEVRNRLELAACISFLVSAGFHYASHGLFLVYW